MVFQNYALLPHLTIAENVGFALQSRQGARALGELRLAITATRHLFLTERGGPRGLPEYSFMMDQSPFSSCKNEPYWWEGVHAWPSSVPPPRQDRRPHCRISHGPFGRSAHSARERRLSRGRPSG
jgi:ABC-type sugar transport system ATPase subunit